MILTCQQLITAAFAGCCAATCFAGFAGAGFAGTGLAGTGFASFAAVATVAGGAAIAVTGSATEMIMSMCVVMSMRCTACTCCSNG